MQVSGYKIQHSFTIDSNFRVCCSSMASSKAIMHGGAQIQTKFEMNNHVLMSMQHSPCKLIGRQQTWQRQQLSPIHWCQVGLPKRAHISL